jgi:hypothetical protein
MANTDSPASYIELTTQAYKLLLDAAATTHKRVLDHAKNHYEIVARPYTGTTPDANIREAFDRANQLAASNAAELQATAQRNAELAEKIAAHGTKVHDSLLQSWHGLSSTGLSNLNYVKEATNTHIDTFAKRVEEVQEIQKRATTAAGAGSKN